jgi:anaerobic magnesium-protoporphyrin IX monomethyl ester cyclase
VQAKPWAATSDREMMIKGRHSRKFYENADRLLRDEVALSRLGRQSSCNSAEVAELRLRVESARAGMTSTWSEVEA